MTLFFKKYLYQLVLLFIGIIWLLILCGLLDIHLQTIIFPDAGNYNESATNLYWFQRGHTYRPILMAAIYGFPLLLGATDHFLYTFAIYVNILLWLSSIVLLFEIIQQYVSKKVAFSLSLLFVFSIGITLFNFHLLAEIPFLFFLLLSFYFLQKYSQTKVVKWLVIALSILVLSMLIKPGSKFFAILLLVYFSKTLFMQYKQKVMLLLYASIGLCIVQAAGLKYQFGDFTISYIDNVTFHNYLFSKADCYRKGIEYNQIGNPRAEYLFTKEAHEQKKIAGEDMLEQIQHNKINILIAYFHNFTWNSLSGNMVLKSYSNFSNSPSYSKIQSFLYWISKYQNRMMTSLGIALSLIFLLKNNRKDEFLFFTALLVVYIIGVSGISSDQGDRFHIITYPFTLVLLANYLKSKPFFAPLQK
ncbi:glycosyltransferase family 39 protein [Flavobacterium lacus]|uniref:Dolichyl-phosphate-mannose-protein mannosyltransferase n=1 Tax=Flavobacterium lacus TaxID=1353778 RepID=A0A328WVG3_9FLAO|nr:glycosyltransferase family 39 protein [Flavobacterium lacus]RAR49116.1 dolichyl-phosphate-mannose-protein mannosyltransferase [Flavobacterium lacus]